MARRGNRLHAHSHALTNFYRRSRYLFPAAELEHILDLQQSEAVQKPSYPSEDHYVHILLPKIPIIYLNFCSSLVPHSILLSLKAVLERIINFVGSHCLASVSLCHWRLGRVWLVKDKVQQPTLFM